MKYSQLIFDDPKFKSTSPHLRRDQIVSKLKESFDFENAHLRSSSNNEDQGVLSKCHGYDAPGQAKDLGIYPYFREIEAMNGSHVTIEGRDVITVSSNNYLDLTNDPRVVEASKKALDKFGTGCTGSRFVNGTLSLHKKLERDLSNFLKREDTIVMSTGYQANQGTIACLLGRKDIAFSDRENHASIYEGCAVAPGKTIRYRHNDMDHLEHCLQKYSDVEGKLIITDSVFSMSGDIANLPGIVKLARDYKATSWWTRLMAWESSVKPARGLRAITIWKRKSISMSALFPKAWARLADLFLRIPKLPSIFDTRHRHSYLPPRYPPPPSPASTPL